jgi:hypothetical protein
MTEEPVRLVSLAEVEDLCRELIAEVRELKARVASLEARPLMMHPASIPVPWPQQPVWVGPIRTGDPLPDPYRITCHSDMHAGDVQ